jgi:Cdc6-like AAA superfamily ATPase
MSMSHEEQTRLDIAIGKAFTPSAPIDSAALFAGRRDQLRAVADAVSQRGQHAVIYGERGVGKTSLANVLCKLLGGEGSDRLAVRVNCDQADTYASLWRKVFGEIVIGARTPVAGFGAEAAIAPERLADNLEQEIAPDVVARVLRNAGPGSIPVIILDEFDRLPDNGVRAVIADTIKALSDRGDPATLVLVGVADTVDRLIRDHASIERSLVQVHMPRMTEEELADVVERGLSAVGMRAESGVPGRIAELSRGLPHYTHLLALNAARRAVEMGRKTVGARDAEGAIERAIQGTQQSILSAYLRAVSSPRRNIFPQVLLASALAKTDELGRFSAVDVRDPLSAIMGSRYEIPAFARHLNEFCGEPRGRVLEQSGTARRYRYRFTNPLLQPYVVLRGIAEGMAGAGERA